MNSQVPSSLAPDELAKLKRPQLRAWLRRRLHREDTLAVPDPRASEYWHLLFGDLYYSGEFDGDFRRHLRAAVLDCVKAALADDSVETWAPEAVDELLMLAADLVNDGTSSELGELASILIARHSLLPWVVQVSGGGEVRLRLRGLTALAELRWDRIPPQLHPPKSYWENLWEPTLKAQSDPEYGYAGEQAGLIFEALEKMRYDGGGKVDENQGLRTAFRWLGEARPWREEYLADTLDTLLRDRLLPQLGAARVEALLRNEAFRGVPEARQREQLFEIFASAVFATPEKLELPLCLLSLIEKTCISGAIEQTGPHTITVTCSGEDREFMKLLSRQDGLLLNAVPWKIYDYMANYLRNVESGALMLEHHRLHWRFIAVWDTAAATREDAVRLRSRASRPAGA